MAIKFRPIEKGQPGVKGGGVKKWYPQIVLGEEATMDEIIKRIELFSSLSGPDIRAVIAAYEYVIKEVLSNGGIVRLGQLGSMRPSLSGKPSDTKEDVTSDDIKGVSIIYTPGKEILDTINSAKKVKI